MKLYIAMINDRHHDPAPYPFTTPEAAIDFARGEARRLARRPEDFEESPVDGWLFYATYSVEDDCVWVLEKTLDDPDQD